MPLSQINSASIENASIAIVDLSATGTPSSTTFLRGDNTWAAPGAASGSVVKIATSTFDGVTSTAAAGIPSTITNGIQLFSVSFTPASASNTILVQTSTIVVSEESNVGDIGWLALWDGSTFIAANSGNALYTHYVSNLNVTHVSLNNSYSAGSTATRTISVRAGFNAGTAYINGNSASYNYTGASQRIQMTVWEIAA
jgi:hypothetical protein